MGLETSSWGGGSPSDDGHLCLDREGEAFVPERKPLEGIRRNAAQWVSASPQGASAEPLTSSVTAGPLGGE